MGKYLPGIADVCSGLTRQLNSCKMIKLQEEESLKKILKNVSYTLLSNLLSFTTSAIVSVVLPKVLDGPQYGYFQLYIFLFSYTGFFHFGWADGMFLRYSGAYYDELDKNKFSAQFWMYAALELIISCLVLVFGRFFIKDISEVWVSQAIGVLILLYLPRTFLEYLLQATNRIKEYASIMILEKTLYVTLVVALLISGSTFFMTFVGADLLGKLLALVYAAYSCRDILRTKPQPVKQALPETKKNIQVGIKLLFANIASMLIIGIVRWSIKANWDIDTFGKISLTLSVSNLLLVFIRAVSMIMLPILRRAEETKLSNIYVTMRNCLMIPLLGMLLFYYPVKLILSAWLPRYADSLRYMALMFPICIFESKISMLIETYLKSLRKEKSLLIVNIVSVAVSLVLTGLTVFVFRSLEGGAATITVCLAFRCITAELVLSRYLDVEVKKDILFEVGLTLIFIVSSWFIGGIIGLGIYLITYIVYLLCKRSELKELVQRGRLLF